MAEDFVIRAEGLSKCYHIWHSPTSRVAGPIYTRLAESRLPLLTSTRKLLRRLARESHREFFALKDVSFEIPRGHSVGIIGRNGSGKSTLLQIIAGTLRPTTGAVEVRGRVAALLELGSGFNPEFTGRENVFLNAAVLGLSPEETRAKFESIESFADIGKFIDQPVKTYSSGMAVRLAFAVQVAVEPDLFIVDEALAVGDVYFQNKCTSLLRQRLEEGMALLLVSHDPNAIRSLCQWGLVLNNGAPAFFGPSDEAVNVYHAIHTGAQAIISPEEDELEAALSENGHSPADSATHPRLMRPVGSDLGPDRGIPTSYEGDLAEIVPQSFDQIQDEIGDGSVKITGCALFDQEGWRTQDFLGGEAIRIAITFLLRRDFSHDELLVGFSLRDRYNNVISAGTTVNQGLSLPALRAGQMHAIILRVPGRLGSGQYLLDVGIGSEPDAVGSPERHHHRIGGAAALTVAWRGKQVSFQGICNLGAEFSQVEQVASKAAA